MFLLLNYKNDLFGLKSLEEAGKIVNYWIDENHCDYNFADINIPKYQANVIRRYGFHDWDACLATLGHGGLKEGQIVNRMYEAYRKDHPLVITDEDILAEHSGDGEIHAEHDQQKRPRSSTTL